ncbi:MAG: hypothetical protein NTV65_07635, partial [Proteobacteria bacterium]|nr:hypothetical protein [Pseudomonadota bacterium]
MQELFSEILFSQSGGKVDPWYSPHLRDSMIDPENRVLETTMRGDAAPLPIMAFWCNLPFTAFKSSCPLGTCKWPDAHREIECCYSRPTTPYKQLITDSNFKACCVRDANKFDSSEKIACQYPDGKGWAGLFEYYYPTSALGWENDRTTTMIVDKDKVSKCVDQAKPLMEGPEAADWVTKAINKNIKAAENRSIGGSDGDDGNVKGAVSKIIKDVRPNDKNKNLRFADSLQSEGLTLRVNLAAMDTKEREDLAKRFCMHPKQFMKLMNPPHDLLQLGGGADRKSLDKIPVWSNYCPKGVNLMTKAENSNLTNVDGTPTDFIAGMKAWKDDPLYCQRMNLQNENMGITGIGEVIKKSQGQRQTEASVGYTCRNGGKLNGGMVPVTLNRHAAVERRTAIADHALGFLIAGGLAEGMIDKPVPGKTGGRKSYYKRFEPMPYSRKAQLFIGKKFKGGDTNELGDPCDPLSGEDYQFKNMSDQLYLSDKKETNKNLTQDKIINQEGKKGEEFNRYVQNWAKNDEESQKKIAERGLDSKSQNYAAPFRIFATCPLGFTRWEPQGNPQLTINLNLLCRQENFGGAP